MSIVFLSTSPARGTTRKHPGVADRQQYFYPRPPRGGRPAPIPGRCENMNFYPRPPRGGRQRSASAPSATAKFLSTSPARGTTWTESPKRPKETTFLSTSPARGTTRTIRHACRQSTFLSTSPARGTTGRRPAGCAGRENFYPRPPRGGRQACPSLMARTRKFLSTSPARGTTANVTENTLHFPATFVTTRYSVQKHAAFLCRMRLFPQRTCTNTLKMITGPRCEPSGVFLRTAGSHLRLAARSGRFCTDAFTPAKYRPAPIAARGRRVRPWSCTGCRAGKNAGCPHPGR